MSEAEGSLQITSKRNSLSREQDKDLKKLSVTAYLAPTPRNTEIWNCHLLSPVINGYLSCCHHVGSSLFRHRI